MSLLPNASPDKVLIDLELAAMKAFEKALPNANISGCFLHLSQNFIRKIGELGLKNLYHSNPELSLASKLLPSLAFEKLENVKSSFKLVVEKYLYLPKVSLFAVNSRYGVFEEKKVPRTGSEGEKRN